VTSKEEQETTVTWNAAGDIRIYSAVPKHLRALRKNPAAKPLTDYRFDYGYFVVKAGEYDPLTGFKRRRKAMTPEQKQVAAARLQAARDRKGLNGDT
jgi:hypothetical protein